jgi:NAD(P)H-flavin reductase
MRLKEESSTDSVTGVFMGGVKTVFTPTPAEIVGIIEMTPTEKYFTLKPQEPKLLNFYPGQIIEASLFGYGEIPIGYASSPTRQHTFDIVVRTVGNVSTAINKLQKGDTLYVRGPLGHGFNLDELRGNNILIIAGGLGLCPTRSLTCYILDRRHEFKNFVQFVGTRSPKEILFKDDIQDWRVSPDIELYETVDTPSSDWTGEVGLITNLFKKRQIDRSFKVIVCGPPVMYRSVIAELGKIGIPHAHIYLDLERRMKCAVGKCGHCQINDVYVCVDGPVFTYEQLKDLEEAFS